MQNLGIVAAAALMAGAISAQACAQAGSGPWVSLLDDRASGWREYRKDALSAGWKVVDGALTRVASGGDIIWATRQFGDFELELDWKVARNGNSGIFYRGTERTGRLYENATEMQVLDNIGHPDNKTELTVAGANYGLYPAPRDAVKPVGEWNSVRIVARGGHVEHWLNGRRVVTYEVWSPEWTGKVKASKFEQWPEYGLAKAGYIGLQDHGDWVAYRNIRVRELR